jgi:hypothetical protein
MQLFLRRNGSSEARIRVYSSTAVGCGKLVEKDY